MKKGKAKPSFVVRDDLNTVLVQYVFKMEDTIMRDDLNRLLPIATEPGLKPLNSHIVC